MNNGVIALLIAVGVIALSWFIFEIVKTVREHQTNDAAREAVISKTVGLICGTLNINADKIQMDTSALSESLYHVRMLADNVLCYVYFYWNRREVKIEFIQDDGNAISKTFKLKRSLVPTQDIIQFCSDTYTKKEELSNIAETCASALTVALTYTDELMKDMDLEDLFVHDVLPRLCRQTESKEDKAVLALYCAWLVKNYPDCDLIKKLASVMNNEKEDE